MPTSRVLSPVRDSHAQTQGEAETAAEAATSTALIRIQRILTNKTARINGNCEKLCENLSGNDRGELSECLLRFCRCSSKSTRQLTYPCRFAVQDPPNPYQTLWPVSSFCGHRRPPNALWPVFQHRPFLTGELHAVAELFLHVCAKSRSVLGEIAVECVPVFCFVPDAVATSRRPTEARSDECASGEQVGNVSIDHVALVLRNEIDSHGRRDFVRHHPDFLGRSLAYVAVGRS